MREASWHKAGGRKNCAKLQSTRGPPPPLLMPNTAIWERGSRVALSSELLFPSHFFFLTFIFWLKNILIFKIPGYICGPIMVQGGQYTLPYSIRSRWNMVISPGNNIFSPKFFVENITFLAKPILSSSNIVLLFASSCLLFPAYLGTFKNNLSISNNILSEFYLTFEFQIKLLLTQIF